MFQVELRNNNASLKGDYVAGYLAVEAVNNDVDREFVSIEPYEFDSRYAARSAIRRMGDEFLDRYDATIQEV